MVLAHAIALPPFIVSIDNDGNIVGILSGGPASANVEVRYKPSENGENRMQLHGHVHSLQSMQTDADWRCEVDLSDNHPQYLQGFIHNMKPFLDVRDGHLGEEIVTKHRIVLTPGALTLDTISNGNKKPPV